MHHKVAFGLLSYILGSDEFKIVGYASHDASNNKLEMKLGYHLKIKTWILKEDKNSCLSLDKKSCNLLNNFLSTTYFGK